MAKEDFLVGLLQGLYQGGVGNPDVNRANRAQSLQEEYAKMARDKMMADQGFVPRGMVQPGQGGPPPTDSPEVQNKIGSFIKNLLYPGSGGGGLRDQYVRDPNPMSPRKMDQMRSLLELQKLQQDVEGGGMSPYNQKTLDLQQQRVDLQRDKLKFDRRAKEDKKKDAQKRVSGNLETMASLYKFLGKKGGIIDTKKSGLENLMAAASASGVGQATGRVFGTEEQSIRNRIKAIQPLLMNDIRQASEMGARGLDSEKELEFYMRATGDPARDLQSNLAAISVLNRAYGLGASVGKVDEAAIKRLNAEFEEYDRLTSGEEQSVIEPGTIEGGYKFIGGDPSDPKSWSPL